MDNEMFERSLPHCLAHDLEAWKEGIEEESNLLGCLWGELYGSINIAEINDGAITHEQAQYLRVKYLWVKDEDALAMMPIASDPTFLPRGEVQGDVLNHM